jgi:hypothetical protein
MEFAEASIDRIEQKEEGWASIGIKFPSEGKFDLLEFRKR